MSPGRNPGSPRRRGNVTGGELRIGDCKLGGARVAEGVEPMNGLRDSEFCWRWFLATVFTLSQRADHLFQFPIKERVVFLPADKVGGHAARDFRLLAALAIGAEEETVRVEAERAGRGPKRLRQSRSAQEAAAPVGS